MEQHRATCQCGRVVLDAQGAPIISTSCHCADCQRASVILSARPGAPQLADPDGGTRAVLFRKDRVTVSRGTELLREHRLTAETPTKRVVAACCETPMYLDFTKGFWLSLYADRCEAAPPVKGRAHSALFMLRLMATWIGMRFHTPKSPGYPKLDETRR